MLAAEKESQRLYGGIGLALGAALLTKFSTLLVVLLIPAALGWRLLERRNFSARDWLGGIGVVLLVCFTVCGWHYGRIWAHFGRPVVWKLGQRCRLRLLQYPGFHTSGYYFRFGQALISPLFSAYHSFGDGIYSTLWGDGLISGESKLSFRPPWNYD